MASELATPARVLGDHEVAAFQRDGFLVPRFRLQGDRLARLQSLAEQLLRDNPGRGDEPMVCPHVPGSGVQGIKGNRAWLDVSTAPDLLDMVEQLLGPDIILWGTNCFHKPAGTGRRIPFHRDGRYWPIEPLATVTVWIAIEPTDRDNGCLRIIPRSHDAREVGEHFTSTDPADAIPETLRADAFDESQAVDVVLEAGQMALFDVYTIHGSWANSGDRRRLGYAMRYMPSTSWYRHDGAKRRDTPSNAHHTRPLFLVRGVDRDGRNDFRRGHPEA